MIGAFVIAGTTMVSIIVLDILAAVQTVNDAEVGEFSVFGTIILQTLTLDAHSAAGTYGSGICNAGCTAIIAVGHWIDALDGIGRHSSAYIHKSGCACIYTCTIRACFGIGIGNRMF